jgi:hypothetical protein
MKKVLAVSLALFMLFMCCSCGSSNEKATSSIVANYSVKSTKDDFIVEVQNLGGVYADLYDANGIHITFKGGFDQIYDKDGNRISREDLNYGDSLEIQYDGTLAKNNPKTIKAYKIIKMV